MASLYIYFDLDYDSLFYEFSLDTLACVIVLNQISPFSLHFISNGLLHSIVIQ